MQTLDVHAVAMLDVLIRKSDALLVLSSTWREIHDKCSMEAILNNAGMTNVPWHPSSWKTPNSKTLHTRGYEIKQWMIENETPEKYIIIDDIDDMLDEQKPNFIKTNCMNGFLWEHFIHACEILSIENHRLE